MRHIYPTVLFVERMDVGEDFGDLLRLGWAQSPELLLTTVQHLK